MGSTKTFAEHGKRISIEAGKVEEKLSTSHDTKDRAGYERKLASTQRQQQALIKQQELIQILEGTPNAPTTSTMAYGGKIRKGADGIPDLNGVDTGLGTYGTSSTETFTLDKDTDSSFLKVSVVS